MAQRLKNLATFFLIFATVLTLMFIAVLGWITYKGYTSCGLEKYGYQAALFNRYTILVNDKPFQGVIYNGLFQRLTVYNSDTGTIVVSREFTMLDTDYTITSRLDDQVVMYTDIQVCWAQLWVRQHKPIYPGGVQTRIQQGNGDRRNPVFLGFFVPFFSGPNNSLIPATTPIPFVGSSVCRRVFSVQKSFLSGTDTTLAGPGPTRSCSNLTIEYRSLRGASFRATRQSISSHRLLRPRQRRDSQ